MTGLTIVHEDPTSPDLAAMHEARIAFNFAGYDPADCFTPPIAALDDPDMRFRVARLDGAPVGMGALRIDPKGWGEIKAVFVDSKARGKGVARALMDALEAIALAEDVTVLRLETGNLHKEALAFYPALGWTEIPRFDPYPANETSLYFEKRLA